MPKLRSQTEFGDFQTPPELARELCGFLADLGSCPRGILEPSCGTGNFLLAALDFFPSVRKALGLEINPNYLSLLENRLKTHRRGSIVEIRYGSFFEADWEPLLASLPDPLLILGNPPWVTNAQLGTLRSRNLPRKTNFQKHSGLDAITGKANFDVSEWMLLKAVDWIAYRGGTLAMLCKTSVARKVLAESWKRELSIAETSIHRVDASRHFGATVDACFWVCRFGDRGGTPRCPVFDTLRRESPDRMIGFEDGQLIARLDLYERWRHLLQEGAPVLRWRSGVKHDCAPVMELIRNGESFHNGLGEIVEIEKDFLYPMVKATDISRDQRKRPDRFMLVPQRKPGEDTSHIEKAAPKTWAYLLSHTDLLNARASSVYRGRPPFSIFGVGEYTFSKWKVAASALHKDLIFRVLSPMDEKPIIPNDTVNFLPCASREEAYLVAEILQSEPAREFFESLIFRDAKRPLTISVLQRLSLEQLAGELGREEEFMRGIEKNPWREGLF